LLALDVGIAVLFAISASPLAQVSEIDGYDRAVTSQTKDDALAFLRKFRSSHLVGDLIESLRPDVAREVCAELPSGVSSARRACEQLREAPVAEAAPGSGGDATGSTQSSVAAAPTQPIETQPIAGVAPAPATTGAAAAAPTTPPQIVAPRPSGQSQIGASSTTAAAASRATVPATMAAGSALPSSGLPEPAATAPPTPITSKPTVYVRSDSGANIHAQATDGSAILGTASSNAPLAVLSRDRNWLRVLVPGTSARAGWVHISMLQSDGSGIKVGPATKTATSSATASASTMPAPAAQVATEMALEPPTTSVSQEQAMTDEEMMRSGIGAVPIPSRAPPAAPRPVTPSAPPPISAPAPNQGTAAASSAISTKTAASPGFRIELLSTKSPTDTQAGWRLLLAAYPDLLASLQFELVEVDLGAAKGVWYRGFAGPIADRDEANMLCTVIKSRPPHSDCFVAGY
jgi:hypothetical protein